MIKRTKCRRKGKFVVLHLVRIMESLVTVFSLGFLEVDWYGNLLFSEWAEDIDEGKTRELTIKIDSENEGARPEHVASAFESVARHVREFYNERS